MKDSYPWYAPYVNAILKLDRSTLTHRVDSARRAIDERIDEIESKGESLSADEREAIEDALSDLRVIEREIVGKAKSTS
jgi:hypothetical protein